MDAGFHSTKDMKIPNNIRLLRIPPYTPELNPCEQVWAYIKKRYKNRVYENLQDLKDWLYHLDFEFNIIKCSFFTSISE